MYDIRLHRYKANFQFRNTFSDEERSSDIEKLSDLLDNCDFFFAAFIFFPFIKDIDRSVFSFISLSIHLFFGKKLKILEETQSLARSFLTIAPDVIPFAFTLIFRYCTQQFFFLRLHHSCF